jgi:hypothetical protein
MCKVATLLFCGGCFRIESRWGEPEASPTGTSRPSPFWYMAFLFVGTVFCSWGSEVSSADAGGNAGTGCLKVMNTETRISFFVWRPFRGRLETFVLLLP